MEGNELKSLILIIVIVSAVFLIFYVITSLTSNKKSNTLDYEVKQETIQYEEILVGQALNQKEKEYYVLIKNEKNNYNDLYVYYLKKYVSSNKNKKYYTVDLSNALNNAYVGDAQDINVKNFFNSKFNDTTLILVKNKKVSKVYSTDDEITKILKKVAE